MGTSSVPTTSCSSAADEVVDVVQPVVLDVEGVAAETGPEGEQHPLGSRGRDVDQGADDVGAAPHVDGLPLGDRSGPGPVHVAVAGGGELRPGGGQDLERGPVVEGERLVGPRLGEPDVDQFPHLVGVLGGQVVGLGCGRRRCGRAPTRRR